MPNPYQDALTQTFEGFDFNRAQDPRRSAKDAFLDLSKKAPVAPIHDKNALGQWFTQHVAPGMNELGHRVSNVQGDKFRLDNWQGSFNLDYGRGAGAQGGALAWQADDANAPPPQAQGRTQAPMLSGQSDLMASILQSLQSDQQALDPQALLLQQMR
jgi:hypothetical protein